MWGNIQGFCFVYLFVGFILFVHVEQVPKRARTVKQEDSDSSSASSNSHDNSASLVGRSGNMYVQHTGNMSMPH